MIDTDGIAAALRELATYLELDGEKFRAAAYARAAASVAASRDLPRLVAEGRVGELPGVGASIAEVVVELARGPTRALEEARARWPASTVELARLPGVGVAKARRLIEALAPSSLDELAEMCETGAVRALPGLGKGFEAKLREAIRGRAVHGAKITLATARGESDALAAHLRGVPAAEEVVVCGATRRAVEVVDTLVLAVATREEDAVRARLRAHPQVASLDAPRAGHAIARLASGVVIELYTAPPARFGTACVLATGSVAHVSALLARAQQRGVALADLEARDEAALYRALGLPLLPPEVRDGTDELAAADAGDDFADLVTLADLTAAVHCHTVASDGADTVAAMAAAAHARHLGLLTITDHSVSAGYASGLTAERLRVQAREIAAARGSAPVALLCGVESDILPDGALDYDDELLAGLDLVIASIHRRNRQDADQMTRRLVAMLRAPRFKIWGHPLGRILLERAPIDLHWDAVLDALDGERVAIEINGDPRRLDLPPERVRTAAARGVRFVLSCDAHATAQLDYAANAVAMARRARLRTRDVLNTLPPDQLARAVAPVVR